LKRLQTHPFEQRQPAPCQGPAPFLVVIVAVELEVRARAYRLLPSRSETSPSSGAVMSAPGRPQRLRRDRHRRRLRRSTAAAAVHRRELAPQQVELLAEPVEQPSPTSLVLYPRSDCVNLTAPDVGGRWTPDAGSTVGVVPAGAVAASGSPRPNSRLANTEQHRRQPGSAPPRYSKHQCHVNR